MKWCHKDKISLVFDANDIKEQNSTIKKISESVSKVDDERLDALKEEVSNIFDKIKEGEYNLVAHMNFSDYVRNFGHHKTVSEQLSELCNDIYAYADDFIAAKHDILSHTDHPDKIDHNSLETLNFNPKEIKRALEHINHLVSEHPVQFTQKIISTSSAPKENPLYGAFKELNLFYNESHSHLKEVL